MQTFSDEATDTTLSPEALEKATNLLIDEEFYRARVYPKFVPIDWSKYYADLFWGFDWGYATTYTKEENTPLFNNSRFKFMDSLTIIAKKVLDKDYQTLIKAGLLDSELRVTDEGRRQLTSLLFLDNKAKLVKVAEEMIAERKENKQ